jgi:hypothetical protein
MASIPRPDYFAISDNSKFKSSRSFLQVEEKPVSLSCNCPLRRATCTRSSRDDTGR